MRQYNAIIISLKSKINTRGRPAQNLLSKLKHVKSVELMTAITPQDFDHDNLHPHTLTTIKNRRDQISYNDLTDIRQIACAYSHIKAWQQCVKQQEPLIIAEDDIASMRKQLLATENALDQDLVNESINSNEPLMISLLHLGSNSLFSLITNKFEIPSNLYEVKYGFYGLQCYFLTPKAAELLLNFANPVVMHVDRYVSDCINSGLMLYRAGNSISIEGSFDSTINHNPPRYYTIPFVIGLTLILLIIIVVIICLYPHQKKRVSIK